MKAKKVQAAAVVPTPARETETLIRQLAARVQDELGIPARKFIIWIGYEGHVMRDENGRQVEDVSLPALLWDYPKDHQCVLLETAQAKSPVPLPMFGPHETCDAMGWCHTHGVQMVRSATEKTLRFAN